MKVVLILIGCLLLNSCVSKGRYNKLLEEIRIREKQNAKLETQKLLWVDKNQVLRDSIQRIK